MVERARGGTMPFEPDPVIEAYKKDVDRTRMKAFGLQVPCLNLAPLIQVKRAAGRPKDLDAIAELEALLEERDQPPE